MWGKPSLRPMDLGYQTIQHPHPVPSFKQLLRQMRANESGSTRDQSELQITAPSYQASVMLKRV